MHLWCRFVSLDPSTQEHSNNANANTTNRQNKPWVSLNLNLSPVEMEKSICIRNESANSTANFMQFKAKPSIVLTEWLQLKNLKTEKDLRQFQTKNIAYKATLIDQIKIQTDLNCNISHLCPPKNTMHEMKYKIQNTKYNWRNRKIVLWVTPLTPAHSPQFHFRGAP